MTKAIDARSIQVREFHESAYGSITVHEYVQVNDPGRPPRLLEMNEVGVYAPDEATKLAQRYAAEGFAEVTP
jgi:hypothetical protein